MWVCDGRKSLQIFYLKTAAAPSSNSESAHWQLPASGSQAASDTLPGAEISLGIKAQGTCPDNDDRLGPNMPAMSMQAVHAQWRLRSFNASKMLPSDSDESWLVVVQLLAVERWMPFSVSRTVIWTVQIGQSAVLSMLPRCIDEISLFDRSWISSRYFTVKIWKVCIIGHSTVLCHTFLHTGNSFLDRKVLLMQ